MRACVLTAVCCHVLFGSQVRAFDEIGSLPMLNVPEEMKPGRSSSPSKSPPSRFRLAAGVFQGSGAYSAHDCSGWVNRTQPSPGPLITPFSAVISVFLSRYRCHCCRGCGAKNGTEQRHWATDGHIRCRMPTKHFVVVGNVRILMDSSRCVGLICVRVRHSTF